MFKFSARKYALDIIPLELLHSQNILPVEVSLQINVLTSPGHIGRSVAPEKRTIDLHFKYYAIK